MAPRAIGNSRYASVQTYEGDVYVRNSNFDVDMTGCGGSLVDPHGETLFGGLILVVGRGNAVIEDCHASYLCISDNTSAAYNYAVKTGNYDKIEFFINTDDPEGFKTGLLSNFGRNGAEVNINDHQLSYSDLYLMELNGNNYMMTLNNVSVRESAVRWSFDNNNTLTINSDIPDYTDNDRPWNYLQDKISNVIFGSECKSVGNNAFTGFNNISHIHIPYGSYISDYCGRGGLPSDEELYFVLCEDGSCPNGKCPINESGNSMEGGICGERAYWEINDGTLYIKGSGNMYQYYIDEYTTDVAPWYEYRDRIKNISISDSIESIGGFAFYGFDNVTSVNIPETITRIGQCAFGNMSGLRYVTVNRDYTYDDRLNISDDVFKGSENICHIHIPFGSGSYNFHGMGGLPGDDRLYFALDEDGYCTYYNCPLGMSRPHEHDFGSKYYSDSEYHWQQCECGEKTEKEAHSYGSEWKSDSDGHWHECKCGYKSESEKHISDNGVVTVKPTETTQGTMTYSCTECGYVIRTEDIPVLETLPSITYESGSVETAEGLSADLSIKASGEGLSYCWKKKVGSGFEDVGCSSDTLHIEKALESNTYICVVSDKNGKSVSSSEMKLTVIAAEDVSAEYVKALSDEECIIFVNYFSSAGEDNFILSEGMMSAVERVLAYDGII